MHGEIHRCYDAPEQERPSPFPIHPIMPLVSILIPVHNSAFFPRALASALGQTLGDFEIIVSDDSTNDAAAETVARYAEPRIRYVRNKPSLGFHGNFAQCYRLASGKYLKFLNHDDLLRPDCLAKMVDAFEQLGSAISLVFSRRTRIDANDQLLADDEATQPLAKRNGPFRGRMLGDHCLATGINRIGEPSAAMFRREDVSLNPDSLFCIDGREYTCLADLALWLRLLAQGDAYYFAESLVGYRVHDAQLQEAAPVRTRCRTERFYLPCDGRKLGFLQDLDEYRRVLDRGEKHIAWAARFLSATEEEQLLCETAMRDLASVRASLP